MLILGLILVAAGVAFGLDELAANTGTIATQQVYGQAFGVNNVRELFLIGVATGAVLLLGLVLLTAGTRYRAAKAARNRRARRAAAEAHQERSTLMAENEELRRRLAERKAAEEAAPVATGASYDRADDTARTGEWRGTEGDTRANRAVGPDGDPMVVRNGGSVMAPPAEAEAEAEARAEGEPEPVGSHPRGGWFRR